MAAAQSGGAQVRIGLFYGFIGMAGFSLTLPVTHVAVAAFGPLIVGFGRAVAAAAVAAVVLLVRRVPLPSRAQIGRLAMVALGVVALAPLLMSWAMARLPASHGAVVQALLPLATAGAAVMVAGERADRRFWIASVVASAVVIVYAVQSGATALHLGDAALLLGVGAAAMGNAQGGALARTLGGWQVISWALVIGAPFLVWPLAAAVVRHGAWHLSAVDWLSLAYVSLGSQFLAALVWLHGLGTGGVARVSQLQYLQPFLAILWSAWLLGERITPATMIAAVLVVAVVIAGGRRAQIRIGRQTVQDAASEGVCAHSD